MNPVSCADDDFVVLDLTGIHEVGVNFCHCTKADDPTKQLLRAKWFPATVKEPKTAATFACLEFFHLLTFESKASVFEFHNTLSRLTDNARAKNVPVSSISSIPVPQLMFLPGSL